MDLSSSKTPFPISRSSSWVIVFGTINIYADVDCVDDSTPKHRFWLGTGKQVVVVQQEYGDTVNPFPHGVSHFLPR